MKIIWLFLLLSFVLFAKDYRGYPEVQLFIKNMTQDYDIDKEYLKTLFSKVEKYEKPLAIYRPKVKKKRTAKEQKALAKMYPKYGAWDRYAKFKINEKRINQGVHFIKKHQKTFSAVEHQFKIPQEYIAAIIGIETVYGKNVGKYPVFDTLTTLAFEKNRRNKFFRKQLEKFIHLSQTQKFNPKNVYGSYAGAIGLGQFMPSNYEAYGVDFNGDGRITLQRAEDAIASIANYLKKNGWRSGEPVATRVSYEGLRFKAYKTGYKTTYKRADLKGIRPKEKWDYHDKVRLIKLNKAKHDELWYGAKNFFVITRYNHSAYYAMSVHLLAMKIKKGLDED
ncbi:MAG: lytic murein transglycosylase B [Epsilonproteobacteria bacterium]|nr:MAG: lytic murein transglycosylase B [Campylobacterota bacterium]